MFEPGTKVICVDDVCKPFIRILYNQWPKKNEVYTVRDIVPGQTAKFENTTTVYLEELKNSSNPFGLEYGFNPNRFREVEEEKEQVKVKIKKQEPVLV